MADETRFSLVPPAPSKLSFELDVPAGAVLRFATGVSALGRELMEAPVEFTILVDGGDGAKRVFEHTVPRRHPDRWFEHRVDFEPWSGKRVRVDFETRVRATEYTPSLDHLTGSGLRFFPVWGNPLLDSSPVEGQRPLLLLISIDCLRADHVSALGYPRETTPFIDRFTSDGVVFEDAVSASSWTLPTHMSLLTGLLPSQHGVTQFHKRHSSIPYLPEILSREGYETIGVVSGGFLSPSYGFEEGFDVYSALYRGSANDVVDRALELMGTSRRERFLFLHFYDAHWPYLAPRRFRERFVTTHRDVSEETTSELLKKMIEPAPPSGPEELRFFKDLYDAELAYIDEELGRLWAALKELGLYENALIVLTADHGEAFYEHGYWLHQNLYNEITHIPLIVKWPERSLRGRVSSVVSQLDVFPTILDAAGLRSPSGQESLARLVGERRAPAPRRGVLSELLREPTEQRGAYIQFASREGALKYLATVQPDSEDQPLESRLIGEELYDISLDPRERKNLLSEKASSAVSFRRQVRDFLEAVEERKAARRGERVVLDEELERMLKALGYMNP